MKNPEQVQNGIPEAAQCSHLIDHINTADSTPGRNFKRFIYIASLAGMGLVMNACATGYVTTEPVYVEGSRPPQPSNMHIWIDGDWIYNHQTHVYVRNNGYWERPSARRTYISGHWQTTPRGQYWKQGHYQRNH